MRSTNSKLLLRDFRIIGLHGYKDVVLEFNGPARIVIAENGMGKTTILSALHSFLEGNLFKLRNIDFDSIQCTFAADDEELVLRRDDFLDLSKFGTDELANSLAEFSSLDSTELARQILDGSLSNVQHVTEHPLIRELYLNSPYSYEEIFSQIEDISATLHQSLPDHLQSTLSAIASRVKAYKVLYMPTYRRIEIPLKSSTKAIRQRPFNISRARRYSGSEEIFNVGIQFGLADVRERLKQLFDEIQRQSNIGYRTISASIIDELLAGLLKDSSSTKSDLPDIEVFARFFSRIEVSESPDQRFQSLNDLYESGKMFDPENTVLRYFLTKLSVVVDQTKELETDIETFVDKANGYLEQSSDEKHIEYNPNEMRVRVQNKWTDQEIALDDLSSGEKQVISLLASLYLYPQDKIVLIDEPELSLSIDWQKRLLPDILDAPSCAQLLAITHSPFIFDNELDPFAGPLEIHRRQAAQA